jgi:glycine betaine/choline ABC-type transport system substrate-binding protein
MKLGLTYRALAAGQVDVIAGNSTDGLIEHLDLVMLEDDKRYFPPYQAAPIMRAASAKKYPAARAAIESLGGKISTSAIRRANFRIDNDKLHPRKAALELLDSLDLG